MSNLHLEFDNSLADLQAVLTTRASYPDDGQAVVSMALLRRICDSMIWAGDEVAQLQEDLHGAMGALKLKIVMEPEMAVAA